MQNLTGLLNTAWYYLHTEHALTYLFHGSEHEVNNMLRDTVIYDLVCMICPEVITPIMSLDSKSKTFDLKFGLHWKQETVAGEMTMDNLRAIASETVDEWFPEYSFINICESLLFFKHVPTSTNLLELIKSPAEITDGCLIEVVLNSKSRDGGCTGAPHTLYVYSYKTPAFCDFCGEMLFGLVKQGLKCQDCGLNFHKRCAYKIPNNCSANKRRSSYTISKSLEAKVSTDDLDVASAISNVSYQNSLLPSPSRGKDRERSASWSCRPVWMEKHMASRPKVPHTLVIHTYRKPTVCMHCRKLLKGLFRQGLQCKDCKFNCHKKCAEKVPTDCQGEVPANMLKDQDSVSDVTDADLTDVVPESLEENSDDEATDLAGQENEGFSDSEMRRPPSNLSSMPYIPLQRIVQSVKNTKRRGSAGLKDGWMVHFTNKDSIRRLHYWRLDSKSITLYQKENTPKFYKEIALADIVTVERARDPVSTDATRNPHCFEISMNMGVIFYVGEDRLDKDVVAPAETGSGAHAAKTWEHAIRQALMPVTPQSSNASTGKPSDKGKPSVNGEKEENVEDISELYQIIADDVLGSGQFGIVYGGVYRKTNREVAIKVIDKLRFPRRQEAQLKNEVAILQDLKYPGIVNLERMFETKERIFVVMEKLKGDMLEMILSQPTGRLSERVTKFLITQILAALKYLHKCNIVHCDLKPENVLLSSTTSEFPQIKLCDFGFARIIGEKSFRRSVVGTPAYLAPEVLRNKGYNRSLDMWSVGVVMYVSLSGTFPFNEDEDINDQIQNADFMYPPNPWRHISRDAVDLINNLLQVKMKRRYSVDKALFHPWLQDYQTYLDIRELERQVGQRYIICEAEDEGWRQYAQQQGIL
ncbi:PREDICTED: serine/threonine-protein kinase D1-like [Priapulus caudatus]|uniref:protein kinase C n=1 Tax=Priapulus caudatus TaxID=37621 RepID=A0ABM1EF72_PRICU|nr:PREDICTED: serine/threonine-protein kinase D1-like [Priapulus caudatus]